VSDGTHQVAALRFTYIQGLSDGAARGLGDGYRIPEELDIT
jgi:hypothetical protein